jgi:hypothetical protein
MNHAPILTPIFDASILAGRTLLVTNVASDPDLPAQSLAWSLVNPLAGATINTSSGLLSWRPTVAQSPSACTITVVVADNGTPSLSSTQRFGVTVLRPSNPALNSASVSNRQFTVKVTGDAGPDYYIDSATNLLTPLVWSARLTNYAPAILPFQWTDSSTTNASQRFYRVRLGP